MTGTNESFSDTPASSQSGQGPGRLVRQAREQAGISIEDLAAQIKLARGTLDAIERDDFAQLNEPVYVRGYYRKLSKVLPVAEAELLDAYARLAGHKAPPHPSKLILAGGAELGSGRRISLKLAAGIIAAGLLIGALAFWGSNRASNAKLAAPVVSAGEAQSASETEATIGLPIPEAAATPDAATLTPSEPATGDRAGASSATPDPQPAASGVSVGPLQIDFNGSSWTEVKDATGRVLLSGLVEAGGSQVLDGKPPFVVFLGNAPAVRITYKGQAIDTAQFRRGDNTARITLP